MQKKLGQWGRNLIPQIKVMKRADKNKDFDPDNWTLVVVEQGIGDQILFLSVMEEAIAEFKNIFLIVELRMKSLIERSFPQLQVGLPGLLESWQHNALKKTAIFPWVAFQVDTDNQLRVLQTTKSFSSGEWRSLRAVPTTTKVYCKWKTNSRYFMERRILGLLKSERKGWQLKIGFPFLKEVRYALTCNMAIPQKKSNF